VVEADPGVVGHEDTAVAQRLEGRAGSPRRETGHRRQQVDAVNGDRAQHGGRRRDGAGVRAEDEQAVQDGRRDTSRERQPFRVDDIDRVADVDEVAGPGHRIEELDDEEGRPAGAIAQQLHETCRRLPRRALPDQLRQLVVVEIVEDDGSQDAHAGELLEPGVDVDRDGWRRSGRRHDEHA
jgi:hypothetical protein